MCNHRVNISTGPVNMAIEVQRALAAPAISHRSTAFQHLYNKTTDLLSREMKVQSTYLLTGSGTLANEAMLWQIKLLGGTGLILSNGEFGARLIEQASRFSIDFIEHKLSQGKHFDLELIRNQIKENNIRWLLFCHCETSTGVINPLEEIAEMCERFNCLCFADCMSTVGVYPLDLSKLAMAAASSGKGLASIPGLAIIFSNIKINSSSHIPVYLDLRFYSKEDGIPFTISSNLVNALYVAASKKLQSEQYELTKHFAAYCYKIFSENNLLPFQTPYSKVFTISPSNSTTDFVSQLQEEQIIISHESKYLKKNDWCQAALFGYYKEKESWQLVRAIEKTMAVYV